MLFFKSCLFVVAFIAANLATPLPEAPPDVQRQNVEAAQALNAKFAGLNLNSPCTPGENACVGNDFAQCVGGKFVPSPCAGGTQCFALPLVNKDGTSITCTTQADKDARFRV